MKGWIIITGLHSKPCRWTKLDETAHLYGETGKDSSWVAGLWIWVMKKNRLEDKTQRSWPVSLIRRVACAHLGSIAPGKTKITPLPSSTVGMFCRHLMGSSYILKAKKGEVPTLSWPKASTNFHMQWSTGRLGVSTCTEVDQLIRLRNTIGLCNSTIHRREPGQTWNHGTIEPRKMENEWKMNGKWCPFNPWWSCWVPS